MDEPTKDLNKKFKERVGRRQEILKRHRDNSNEQKLSNYQDDSDTFVSETEKPIPDELGDLDSIFKTIYNHVPMNVKDIKYRNVLKENLYVYSIMSVIGFSMWVVAVIYCLY